MNKTNYLPYVHVGNLELTRAQELALKNFVRFIDPLIVTHGLKIQKDFNGNYEDYWKVTEESITTVRVKAGDAFLLDENGNTARLALTEDQILSIPSENGTYKVMVKHKYSNLEQGTIDVTNGSAIVSGSGTEFTKIFAVNRRLIIGSEVYSVLAVNGNGELELTTNYTGVTNTGLQFKVGGWWTNPPATLDENLIYEHDALELVVKNTAKLDAEYWLAEVTMTSGIITNITDKRSENVYTLYSEISKLTSENIRTKKTTIFRPESICANTGDADATDITEHIKATDLHPTTFQSKLIIGFYKSADDKLLTVDFTPFYTSGGGELSAVDKTKWQVRIDVEGQANGTEVYLSETHQSTYDISSLATGYYKMIFKLKKAATAFDLSIYINEAYITGNQILVVEN